MEERRSDNSSLSTHANWWVRYGRVVRYKVESGVVKALYTVRVVKAHRAGFVGERYGMWVPVLDGLQTGRTKRLSPSHAIMLMNKIKEEWNERR